MFKRLQILVLSASVLWKLSSAVPADPTITTAAVLPRQNSDNFIGWLELNNTWSSYDCDAGLTWYQNGQYAQCCPATLPSCYAATACVGGSQIYTYPDRSSVRTIACTENYGNAALSICNTIYIYENTQDSNPRTNINCGDSSVNWSYYRDIPASFTEQMKTSPATSVLQSTANNRPTQTAEPNSESKGWIAGAVVGPILGLALLGLGIWFFLRRRKKASQTLQHGTASMAPIDSIQPLAGVGGYTDAKPQFATSQPGYYNQPGQPESYTEQGYPQQGGYSPPQMSPAPQYGFQSAYNATSSPRPHDAYPNDANDERASRVAELDSETSGILPAAPPLQSSPSLQAAELGGTDITSHTEGVPGGAELPTNAHNKLQ